MHGPVALAWTETFAPSPLLFVGRTARAWITDGSPPARSTPDRTCSPRSRVMDVSPSELPRVVPGADYLVTEVCDVPVVEPADELQLDASALEPVQQPAPAAEQHLDQVDLH